jgi:hypothetical protein
MKNITIKVGDTFLNTHCNTTEVVKIHGSGALAKLLVTQTGTEYQLTVKDIKSRIKEDIYTHYTSIEMKSLKYSTLIDGKWYKLLCNDGRGIYGMFKNKTFVNTRQGQLFIPSKGRSCEASNTDYHHLIQELTSQEITWVKWCIDMNIKDKEIALELLKTEFKPVKINKNEVHRQITEQGEPGRKGTRAIREKIKIASAIRPTGSRITNLRGRGSVRRTTLKRSRLFTY